MWVSIMHLSLHLVAFMSLRGSRLLSFLGVNQNLLLRGGDLYTLNSQL